MSAPLSETELDDILASFTIPSPVPDFAERVLAAAAATPQGVRRSGRPRWRRLTAIGVGATLLVGGAVAAAVGEFPALPRLAEIPALLMGRLPAQHAPSVPIRHTHKPKPMRLTCIGLRSQYGNVALEHEPIICRHDGRNAE